MKSVKSFDVLLLAILLVVVFAQIQHKLVLGTVVYFGLVLMGLLVIRWVVGAQTINEARLWLRFRMRIAYYLIFIWVVNLVYVGYSFWNGYLGLVEAIGVYLMVIVVFSALVLLGQHALQRVLKVFGSKK